MRCARHRWCRSRAAARGHQQCAEGILAQAPGEAEEGVDEDGRQQDDLEVEYQSRGARRERDLAHQGADLLGGRQHRQQAADDEDGGGGEERRAGDRF